VLLGKGSVKEDTNKHFILITLMIFSIINNSLKILNVSKFSVVAMEGWFTGGALFEIDITTRRFWI
jgi:hypothetical protein